MITFQPLAMLEALHRHTVAFVVVGAWAVEAQGIHRSQPTMDLDITPQRTQENLDRLSAALDELDMRIRSDAVVGGLPFDHDGESLARATVWNLTSAFGDLDLACTPAGFPNGYDDLIATSVEVDLDMALPPLHIRVAAVADVIRSKQQAGRPKDLTALPEIIQQARALGLYRG